MVGALNGRVPMVGACGLATHFFMGSGSYIRGLCVEVFWSSVGYRGRFTWGFGGWVRPFARRVR